MNQPTVIIEFYGIPRARAGRTEITVSAATAGDALRAAAKECPGLGELIQANGKLISYFRLSLDGKSFVLDLERPIQTGDRLLLISADAGG